MVILILITITKQTFMIAYYESWKPQLKAYTANNNVVYTESKHILLECIQIDNI